MLGVERIGRRAAIAMAIIAGAAWLTACVSQFAKPYIGKDVVELELENGKPVNIVELPGGRRSYQYMWGGGTAVVPGSTFGTATTIGRTTFVQAQSTPAVAVSSEGCRVNFIAERHGDRWIVVDAKGSQRLVC